jgi:hypothetical protein
MSTDRKTQPYLLSIWYQPRQTIHNLTADGGAEGHGAALCVAAIFGFFVGIRLNLVSASPSYVYLALGALCGLGGLYILALLLRNFSRLFGGAAPCRQVRTALGLACLPWTLLLGFLLVLLFKEVDAVAVQSTAPLLFAVFIYGYAIILMSLMAALGISALRTFVCLCLALLVAFFSITLLLRFFI